MEQKDRILDTMPREKLVELIGIYSKNWLALDGSWFQSVERKSGMDAAMFHDIDAWGRFTVTEARRIKAFLGLDEHPGLEGLAQALQLRFYSNINSDTIEIVDDPETGRQTLIYRMVDCFVQSARAKKGMDFHPCKPLGIVEYSGFGRTIDDRIQCRCISCYPEVTDSSCCCRWEFWIE
jgi:hypothetical protein